MLKPTSALSQLRFIVPNSDFQTSSEETKIQRSDDLLVSNIFRIEYRLRFGLLVEGPGTCLPV